MNTCATRVVPADVLTPIGALSARSRSPGLVLARKRRKRRPYLALFVHRLDYRAAQSSSRHELYDRVRSFIA